MGNPKELFLSGYFFTFGIANWQLKYCWFLIP
jgi:hypothetical protein